MIEISDNQYWRKLNNNDMTLVVNFIVIDGVTGWRLPNYQELLEVCPIVYGDNEIYIDNIWSLESWGVKNQYPNFLKFWLIPVRDI
jgi:hypothetical protein